MILKSQTIRCFVLISSILALSLAADRATANESNSKDTLSKSQKKSAISFVAKHHAELVGILKELETSSPTVYAKAIKELHQTQQRLLKFKERDSQRYEIELGIWKSKSRSQLLSAQIQMGDAKELQAELRAVLAKKADLQIQLLIHERSLAKRRLDKIDASIKKLEETKEASIDKWVQNVLKSKENRRKKNAETKPVSKNPNSADSRKVEQKKSTSKPKK